MQTFILIHCNLNTTSLRTAIFNAKEGDLETCRLKLSDKKKGKNTWLNLSSTEPLIKGAIKVTWDGNLKLLTARIVNRSKVIPDKIIGDFITFVLWQYSKKITSITITKSK
jgi:hypothetical protein